jgi:DsbC/DsbD-like thiol-disulfide interchange protein
MSLQAHRPVPKLSVYLMLMLMPLPKVAFPTAFALTLVLAGSSRAGDSSYEVSKTDASLTAGTKGKASVTISAKKGWHLNAEAPLTLKLVPAAGVDVDKAKLGRGDLAASNETSARFDIAMTAAEPGKKTVEAEAGFVLCQEDSCRPVKEKVTFAVDVAPSTAAPAKRPGKKK